MMNIGFAGARPRAVQSSAPVETHDQVEASGGIVLDYVRENGETWRSHRFNASDMLTVQSKGTVHALLIGGAGAGGYNGSGGGASGGLLMPTIELEPASYSCVVGAGGSGGEYQDYAGKNGTPTSFRGYVAASGGGGRGTGGTKANAQFKDGASGGGASADYQLLPGLSIEYQGNDGGLASSSCGAGGGGFVSPGGDATENAPGIGGDGIAIEFGGYSIEVCAGAGGLGKGVVAPSGLGGPETYGDGPLNSGSGGTGGNSSYRPGNGASGLIIIEYRVY